MGSPVSPSLAAEAEMMAGQLVADLSEQPEAQIVLAALPPFAPRQAHQIVPLEPASDPAPIWRRLIAGADIVWPVAPETGGALQNAAVEARRLCDRVLISDDATLAITSSKRRTAAHLARHDIATVPTYLVDEALPPSSLGWVIKPDDGAGAEATYRVKTPPQENDNIVIQPFIAGAVLSLSLLARNGEAWLLSCNIQEVAPDGDGFTYRGFIIGGAEHRRAALEPIAHAVAAALPGLWGYIGIDIIDAAEGPKVLEINPRLTTSYAGLRESLGFNPAKLVLDLIDHPITALRRPVDPKPVRVSVSA